MQNEKKKLAASIIATGGSGSEAARQANVNRSTIGRWLRDPEFQQAVVAYKDQAEEVDVSDEANQSLSDLLPQAVGVIERALSGDKTLVQSARVALDVIKTAASLAPKGSSGDSTPPLADLISELDKREKSTSSRN